MDRDATGQFVKGGPGGPGRPPRQTEREHMRLLMQVCTEERILAIFTRITADALKGDHHSQKLLMEYLVGKPHAKAPSLTLLAVEQEADIDPLASVITQRKEAS